MRIFSNIDTRSTPAQDYMDLVPDHTATTLLLMIIAHMKVDLKSFK